MPWKRCTATKALSRPWAGESSASSPALKRSSTGNETGWRSRIPRAARTASAARSRGTAYSISSKRTRRGEANTEYDQPTRSRRLATEDARRLRRGMAAGTRRASRLTAWKARLSSSTSFTYARAAGGSRTGASVRSLARVSATSEGGNVKNSKWSCASARAPTSASTSASGSGPSTARSRKAGTQRKVTATTTPSAPTPTRPARSRSPPSSVRSRPSARTSSIACTWPDRFGNRAPVPCVPVASAPASDWTSMSPRFGMASPRACSSRERACSRIPASTRTRPDSRSASSTRSSASSEISVPSVATTPANEGRPPATRMGATAPATTRATSARVRGRSIATGAQRCDPDQLTQAARVMQPDGTVPPVDIEPERVAELHDQGAIQLVDVREPYEWAAGHIPGARHVQLNELASRPGAIDRERPVVFVCRVGGRSGMAAAAFRDGGYDAYNLAGGVLAWAGGGLPFDGEVADH